MEMSLAQRSKATRLKLGDDNTKYFYAVIKQRRLQQAVTQLQGGNLQIHTEPNHIAEMFVENHKNLVGEVGTVQKQQASNVFLKNGKTLSWSNKCNY